jgi:hypothetical protein
VGVSGSQRLVVLLCKFSDAAGTEPHPDSFYRDLVQRSGTGGLADYWPAASLDHIDLNGSDVFGWKVIEPKRDDFVNAHPDRWSKIQGAIDAFPEVPVSTYAGVIAVFNIDVGDSANKNNGVLCGPGDGNVTFLAHETGHIFGLQHSFDMSGRKLATWSAPGEYYDRADIMSAMTVDSDAGSPFSPLGPLLATPNLDRMGWLDPARVWTPAYGGGSSVEQVDLVSLGHPDVPGYLAAKVENLYVEFRTADGWDRGLPRAALLIHTLRDPNAVVIASDAANYINDWQPGQSYGPSAFELAIHGGTVVHIDSFNLPANTARITITHQARPVIVEGPVSVFGGVAQDGGGLIVLPSGKFVRVPPHSPVLEVLDMLAVAADTQALSPVAQRAVQLAVARDVAAALRSWRKGQGGEG